MESMTTPIIKIDHLTKVFHSEDDGSELVVLDDVNLEIEKGEIFGIIGRSGAGKSTLVRCINYLERPTGGDVVFEGTRLADLTKKELYKTRESMGMIFQQFNLLMQRSALGNVLFPFEIEGAKKSEAKEKALELLDLVGIKDKAKACPAQLSGGQRQRVAIARAIALNPKILLCDEATSALDPETTQGVLELLKDINKKFGITIVVITHEMSVIDYICNRVAIIHEGNIAEIGKVSEVFTAPQSPIAKKLLEHYRYEPKSTIEGGAFI
jgi:D-methionine transport system ATP-binding protein